LVNKGEIVAINVCNGAVVWGKLAIGFGEIVKMTTLNVLSRSEYLTSDLLVQHIIYKNDKDQPVKGIVKLKKKEKNFKVSAMICVPTLL